VDLGSRGTLAEKIPPTVAKKKGGRERERANALSFLWPLYYYIVI
jgi:hypothetical protein